MRNKQRAIELIEETYQLICEGKTIQAKGLLEKRVNNLTVNIPPFIEPAEPHTKLAPECQVRNEDTCVFKTMTRESAKKLQVELGGAVVWSTPFDELLFNKEGIYTYNLKAKKSVSWKDMPVGVAVYTTAQKLQMGIFQGISKLGAALATDEGNAWMNQPQDLILAPSCQQPWIAVQDEFIPVAGLAYETRWGGRPEPLALAYRVIGIADGWELK